MLEKKHGKSFVAEHSHHLFAIIWVILHPGPLRCAGEYTLHYLDGQSLRNPCVFGPAEEGSSKNNTGRKCDLFIFFPPVTSVQPYRYVYFKIKAAKGINVRVPRPRGFCSIGFLLRCPPPHPRFLLQSFGWRTGRQLSVKVLSKMLILIDEIICARSALSHNRHR